MNATVAYHFVGETLRDGRPVPADGEWLVHDGPAVLCESGLHASRRPWHALQYALGETLCLVEVTDIVAEEDDKLVSRRRRIVRRVDLTEDLRAFARQCARDVLHLWDAPDVVRRYLESGDETLRDAAWKAAWSAAWPQWAYGCPPSASREAAWAAARAAQKNALDAAREAANSVAWAAALRAEWNAAWAAKEAAWDAQGARFDAICRARLGVTEED